MSALPGTGLPAVVFQHEFDHMDGMLHTDREQQAYMEGSRQQLVERAHHKYIAELLYHYNINASSSTVSPSDW